MEKISYIEKKRTKKGVLGTNRRRDDEILSGEDSFGNERCHTAAFKEEGAKVTSDIDCVNCRVI